MTGSASPATMTNTPSAAMPQLSRTASSRPAWKPLMPISPTRKLLLSPIWRVSASPMNAEAVATKKSPRRLTASVSVPGARTAGMSAIHVPQDVDLRLHDRKGDREALRPEPGQLAVQLHRDGGVIAHFYRLCPE